jgi:hypothetical protein
LEFRIVVIVRYYGPCTPVNANRGRNAGTGHQIKEIILAKKKSRSLIEKRGGTVDLDKRGKRRQRRQRKDYVSRIPRTQDLYYR